MSYQALARKWRPQQFADVVGQDAVVRALSHALDRNQLHHAYLFTGTRGVGKTTLARIFAKCLNCETGVTSTPCGVCTACVEIAEGRFMDLLEVDAASQRKVEQTQDMLDTAMYAPVRGRYKVYIIDEVHQLSGHSFNAFLKTLEEPPPHVKFLLATTDPQKLPATVLSRCLQFSLKNMPPEKVAHHLADVLQQEGVGFEPAALNLLGRAADGSLRDAMSLTDQAIAFGEGHLSEAGVRDMLGSVDRGRVLALATAIARQSAAEALSTLAQLADTGADFDSVLQELLSIFHRAALVQQQPDLDGEEADSVRELAGLADARDLQLFYQIALQGRRDLPLAPDGRSGVEMLVCRMLAFRVTEAGDDGVKKKPVEPRLTTTVASPSTVAAVSTVPAPVASLPLSPTPEAVAVPEPERDVPVPGTFRQALQDGLPDWAALLPQLPLPGFLRNLATHCELISVQADHWQFLLDHSRAEVLQPRHEQQLAEALSACMGSAIRVSMRVGQPQDTPHIRQQRVQAERRQQAKELLQQDRVFLALHAKLGGQIDEDSIRLRDDLPAPSPEDL